MKKSKKITNKNNSYRKLSISILIAITIFLTGSVYAATNFGVGPFSSFLPIPSINRVSDFDDPLVSNAVQKKANDAANLAVTKVARLEQEVKADPTPKKVKDLQEAQAEEVVAVNVSALAAKVVVDTNNSNTKTDLQFGSVADTAGVNSTYNALKAATEAKLIENNVIAKTSDSITINSGKMEDIKNQFANKDVKTNAGSCGTNGAPVLEGTWVSSGHPLNADGSKCESGASCPARECMKCGKDGNYEGSQTCSSVLTQGQPVVLPQQAGGVYTGISDKNITLSSCFSKVNGTLTQIAIGQSQGDAICAPTGSMIKKTEIPEDVIAKLNDYCKLNKQEWKDGKCQNSAISQESLNSELAKAKIAEAARQKTLVDAAKLSAKQAAEKFERERFLKTYEDYNCGGPLYLKDDKCVPVQETGKFAIVPKDFVGRVVSYNVGASAGRPSSFIGQYSDTTYSSELQCKTALRSGETCVSVATGTVPQYKIVINKPFMQIDFGSTGEPLSPQNSTGIVGEEVVDPRECKYTPAVKRERTDKWVCPTEETVKKFTPVSNERPAGQTAYIAPGNKLYNGGSCYADNGACVSGYCQVKFGFDKCADAPQTGPQFDPSVISKVEDIYSKIKESGDCTETNIDEGIRINCNSETKEPIISYCDQGKGKFDEKGICIPAFVSRSELIETAKIQRMETKTINGAVGLTAACSIAVGVSLVMAPASLGGSLAVPVAICGSAGLMGGLAGYFSSN